LARVCSLALACVLSLAFASAASASTTVGQLFTPDDECNFTATELQTGVTAGNSYTVPSAGVITSWSFHDGTYTVPDLAFKAAHHLSGDDYKIVGTSPAGTQTANAINTYPTQITVQTGDVIGVYVGGGTCVSSGGSADSREELTGTNEPLNATHTYTPYASSAIFPVAATVEPDADHDGYGDETQDQCPTDATKQAACPTTTPQPPTSPARDRLSPALTVSVAKLLKLSKTGALSFFMTSNESATGSATGTISVPGSAKTVRFKTTKLNLTGAKRTKITLKLPKRALKAVRLALKHHKLKARVTVTVKDGAGNRTAKKLTIRLKR
jgi:hypothetical protein